VADAAGTAAKEIVLGVSGGIAAYKACELLRRLREAGNHVQVVATPNALVFVGAATFEALSGREVLSGVFEHVPEVTHVALGRRADLVVCAPATADLIARLAAGRADDLLTSTLLTARAPVLVVPAMHTEMWEHPATRENVATLRRRGTVVLEPASGRLTGADSGPGRLPEPVEIAEFARLLIEVAGEEWHPLPRDLEGRHVVVSAGGTAEPLDPVRTLGNRSSGRQGYALARVAAQRGAHVTLVAGTTAALEPPAAVEVVSVRTTEEMRRAVVDAAKDADVVVMAAAVADFRPASVAGFKIRRATASRTRSLSHAIPTSSPSSWPSRCPVASSWASPPRPGTRPTTCSPSAGRSSPARGATCSSSTPSAQAGAGVTRRSRGPTTRAGSWAPTGRRTRCRGAPRPRSRPASGTRSPPA
jgi:phosphopantothenoylcysteine decarboxylase/phosphopantothenate--cysteine ligase